MPMKFHTMKERIPHLGQSRVGPPKALQQVSTKREDARATSGPIRISAYIAIFALILALAAVSYLSQTMSARGLGAVPVSDSVPIGETIPPNGTIPPASGAQAGEGKINIIHAAPFDANLANTEIQITDINGPVNGLSNLQYLEQSGFVSLTPGNYSWTIVRVSDNTPILNLDFYIGSKEIVTMVITGGANGYPFETFWVYQVKRLQHFVPYLQK